MVRWKRVWIVLNPSLPKHFHILLKQTALLVPKKGCLITGSAAGHRFLAEKREPYVSRDAEQAPLHADLAAQARAQQAAGFVLERQWQQGWPLLCLGTRREAEPEPDSPDSEPGGREEPAELSSQPLEENQTDLFFRWLPQFTQDL